jgi:hypothetical protein
MLKQRDQIRAKMARLESELKEFTAAWRELSVVCSDPRGKVFKFSEEKLFVFNLRDEMLFSAKWLFFTKDKVEDLFADLQNAGDELDTSNERLKALGVE